jgi:hypothetical protein
MFREYRFAFNPSLLWKLIAERIYAWFLVVYTPAVAVVVSEFSAALPAKIRYAGVIYNFTAIVVAALMVARGVYKHRVPSAFVGWSHYFARFFDVFFRLRAINAEVKISTGSVTSVGTAIAHPSLSGNVDDKIGQLDERTRNMEAQVDILRGALDRQSREFEEKLKSELKARSEESEAVRQFVRESLFGDHGWEIVVAFYLVLGLMANIPDEIAKLVFGYTGP